MKKGWNSTTQFWIGLLYDDWEWADGGNSAFRKWGNTTDLSDNYTVLHNESSEVNMKNTPIGNVEQTICSKEKFHLIKDVMTWEEALNYCNDKHKTLLRIESEDDQRIVQQRLKGENVPGPVWIGLRQSRLLGFWVWTNGMKLTAEDWICWEGGRLPELPESHHCGAMATEERDVKWSDQDCLSRHYFICEE
ncbi:hypothetical protein DPEC_G00108480 [Dallia pectoralis]|uniref:Uncharacterized protein n=1 Tax=Dallia pectoralis TaxID=75939 RepID=A0ACC2GSF0_DALPE|nr:hypothetical protein DPEC_G00108480 [Dallia pectoralis]